MPEEYTTLVDTYLKIIDRIIKFKVKLQIQQTILKNNRDNLFTAMVDEISICNQLKHFKKDI